MNTSELRVNGDRLWDSLMRMAQIGATPKGGVCRLALTDLDLESRDLLSEWCASEGCDRKIDPMGNLFFRRLGTSSDDRPVGAGSHLDSQPTGGKFDGAYGVLAALEVIRTLNDNDVSTDLPVELVVWTNEEGSRFPPAMIGSAIYAGVFDLEYGHSRADLDGRTMGEELKRIGYLGDSLPKDHQFSAFFEAHIEQGPILEEMELPIGVVTGVQGVNWYDVTITGEETHAGPTPMDKRRDALRGASELLPKIYQIAWDAGFDARITLGEFRIYPGSRNTVPSRVEFSIDMRHPKMSEFDRLDQQIKDTVAQFAEQSNLDAEIDHIWRSPPIEFNPECIEAVRSSAKTCGYEFNEMVSGAGHDSVYISGVAPTSMIFVPCDDGVSHNEFENISKEQAEAGANVLLHSVLSRAGLST